MLGDNAAEKAARKGGFLLHSHQWYVMLYSMVKAKRKTEHITLLVDKQVLRAVAVKCAELGVTRSQYLRALVVKDLQEVSK